MSDLFGNHIVGFPTRRLICQKQWCKQVLLLSLVLIHSEVTLAVSTIIGQCTSLCITISRQLVAEPHSSHGCHFVKNYPLSLNTV